MRYLVYTFLLFVLISEPAHVSNGQNKTPVKALKSSTLINQALANTDSILMQAKKLPEVEPVVKEKIVTKWRTVYRTKVKEVRDTVYISLPENDTLFIPERCIDTVYIDRPILVKKKGFFKRLF